ncbi:septum formation family protein [Salinifilum aidingensis]
MAETDSPRSQQRRSRNTRLIMVSAAIGALLILLISTLLNWPTGEDEGSGGGPGGIGAAPTPQEFNAPRGACLNWTQVNASDLEQVRCDQPHLFEITGKADIGGDFPPNAPYPSTEQWQQLKQQRCAEVSTAYLQGAFDPDGRLAVGAFTPSEEGWGNGDRTLHCGLQQPGPSGELYRMSERAADMDQSNVYDVGRCLGINGTAVWDPVDCSRPHAAEITGTVNLGDEFSGEYPPAEEQDNYLATRCREITAEYAGGPQVVEDKGLVTYWDTLSEESWAAGSRLVNCKVSAQLPDGSGLAPVTGGVRGEVSIGDEPAPKKTGQARPGAPAEGQR